MLARALGHRHSSFLNVPVRKAEVRPARLGWLTSSWGALLGGLVKKGFCGRLSTGPGVGRTSHAMGEWGSGGAGGGWWAGPCFSLQSLLLSQNLARDPDLSPFCSPPFPTRAKVPIPRPLPGLKNRESQATNGHQDRLPLYSKKGHFYFVSSWLIVVMYFVSRLI